VLLMHRDWKEKIGKRKEKHFGLGLQET